MNTNEECAAGQPLIQKRLLFLAAVRAPSWWAAVASDTVRGEGVSARASVHRSTVDLMRVAHAYWDSLAMTAQPCGHSACCRLAGEAWVVCVGRRGRL